MKKNKKKQNFKNQLVVVIPVIIAIIVCIILTIICIKETNKISVYFESETQSSIPSYINDQYEINQKLMKVANNKNYTLDNAYVELNPYKISPLSAIIIFQTKEDEAIKVTINGYEFTTTEASKKHSIPIYGLYEDTTNVVVLEAGDQKVSYAIKTEKSGINYPLNIDYASAKFTKNDIYFTVASYETWLTGWDTQGKLRFYLTQNNRMDVEWLDNGHFIIGTAEGQFAENFVGFVEMDYLGKVYNYYVPENGFSFESQILSNGHIMAAGGVTPVYVKEQVVYELDPKTGKKVSDINLSKIFKDIYPQFEDKYLGQKAIRNGFYYNEETKELVVSFRGWDTVFSVNYETKELNWIFTDPKNELFSDPVWNQYKVTLVNGRYPLGQHSTKITKDGYIAFFNNGYNRLHGFENGGEDKETSYLRNYSSAEMYDIKNKRARLVWSYNANKKLFSHQYGSVSIDDDNNKLVNFGYNAHDNYRHDKNGLLSESEKSPEHIYASIVEVDKYNRVIFRATCEEGKYRAFRHTLYNEETQNVDLGQLSYFNKVKKDKLDETSYKKLNLDTAQEWIYSLELTDNTLTTNYDIAEPDNIDIYFVNKSGKVFILNYKDKNDTQLKRIFNVDLNGTYAIFIKVNDTLYNAHKVYEF